MSIPIQSHEDLNVYKKSFQLAMDVFDISKSWPKEETYSLIDQVRRSSRSVGANMAEAWGKRRYLANFISKLSDCDAENRETPHWIRIAFECQYITEIQFEELIKASTHVGAMIGKMIKQPNSFILKQG